MGGIDLLDSLCFMYKIRMKCHRWYIYIWHHTLHIAVVNAWLLYRRQYHQLHGNEKSRMVLKDFQMAIADSLLKRNKSAGRPSLLNMLTVSRKRPCSSASIQLDIRYDMIDHFPIFEDRRNRCKLCPSGAKDGFTFVKCNKCGIHLCLNKNRNCFYLYHHK